MSDIHLFQLKIKSNLSTPKHEWQTSMLWANSGRLVTACDVREDSAPCHVARKHCDSSSERSFFWSPFMTSHTAASHKPADPDPVQALKAFTYQKSDFVPCEIWAQASGPAYSITGVTSKVGHKGRGAHLQEEKPTLPTLEPMSSLSRFWTIAVSQLRVEEKFPRAGTPQRRNSTPHRTFPIVRKCQSEGVKRVSWHPQVPDSTKAVRRGPTPIVDTSDGETDTTGSDRSGSRPSFPHKGAPGLCFQV